ncbi:hypothetical protein CspeluHIS016_0207370 [Cutaneotrichosporon spelunceum]|uniref:Uncharacterized protein n=1 Tax=Cutaneotrichosporon spelunceum TaxID=1672016 RepID=A0AAD3TSJ5_9TREE|nr:hypothetical protein CspeluHIS016_0207370 [Cutaneotrichosporon spelunceum]
MFARPALRATTVARVGLYQPTPIRAMSASATASKASKMKQLIINIPVDLYPLAFFVTGAVGASFFIMGWTLWTDPHLRLKPTSMQQRDE